jgi:pimeloyl-ACP methyl ester carboxylesterase
MNKVIAFILLLVLIVSCNKKDDNIIDQQYFLRYKDADLCMWMKGNIEKKTFIIIIHGGPGGTSMDYRIPPMAGPLEDDYVVVWWDQRGSGASQGNYSYQMVTVDQYAEDLYQVVRFVKELHGDDISVFLLGHSWGGMLGSAYMTNPNYSKEIDGWINSDGAHNWPLLNTLQVQMFIEIGTQEIELGNDVEKWTEIVEYCEGLDSENLDLYESVQLNQYAYEAERLLSYVNPSATLEVMTAGDLIKESYFSSRAPVQTFLSDRFTNGSLNQEMIGTKYEEEFAYVETPTLMIWGKYDFVTPPSMMEHMDTNLVNTKYKRTVLMENSGHSPMDTEPDKFINEVITFIEEFRK